MKWKEIKPHLKTREFKACVMIAAIITLIYGIARNGAAAAVTAVVLWVGCYLMAVKDGE